MYAAGKGNIEVVKILLKYNADVQAKDNKGTNIYLLIK